VLGLTISEELCSRCGECRRDCIAGIIEQIDDTLPFIRPENEPYCIRCQHCLAVCPDGALSIHDRNPAESEKLCRDTLPQFDQMVRLVRGRRSVRHYKNENVDPGVVKKLLAALANVPTGENRQELTFTVIDDKEAMRSFREKALTALASALAAKQVPENARYLHEAAPEYFENGRDIIFRGAPHLLIASASTEAPCSNEDVVLALAYFELLAQSGGIGTVWCGMLKMLLDTLPEMKRLLSIPESHYYYAMLFGPPSVRYHRTVQRDDSATIRRVTLEKSWS
jgi:nitroreductase/NAD-dependent dihydropyrimidine dehydrogenase PreA subunit